MRYSPTHRTPRVVPDMRVLLRTLLLICASWTTVLIVGSSSEGACLQDGKHKATPSPEPHLMECTLYADSE